MLRVADSRFNAPILVCNEEHRLLLKRKLQKSQITILYCLSLKVKIPRQRLPWPLNLHCKWSTDPLLVMPADHHISDFDKLIACLDNAIALCQQQQLVTFAITPPEPHTGYGYIRQGEPLVHEGCFKVADSKKNQLCN